MTLLWLEKLGIAVLVPNVRGSIGYGKRYQTLDDMVDAIGIGRENR